MQKNISTERSYTIGFNRIATKECTGIQISVTGDSKIKVEREAMELYENAINACKALDTGVKSENV